MEGYEFEALQVSEFAFSSCQGRRLKEVSQGVLQHGSFVVLESLGFRALGLRV